MFILECNEARTACIGEVGPGPLEERNKTIAQSNQVVDMYDKSHRHGNYTCEAHLADVYNGIGAPYCSQVALVAILKGLVQLLASDTMSNQRSHVAPGLHSDWSNPGQRFTVLRGAGSITNHKHVRMTRDGQIPVHLHATCAVHLGAKPFSSGRGRNTCGPDDRFCCDTLTPGHDAMFVYR